MKTLTPHLQKLYESDPDLALVMDVFEETDRVYREALEAMGVLPRQTTDVRSTAEANVAFRSSVSTSDV